MSTTAADARTFPWGRLLGAVAFAVGALTFGPAMAEGVAAGGGVFHAVATATVLAVVGCGWRHHGPWLPARITSLYFFGLAAGTLGGAVTAVV